MAGLTVAAALAAPQPAAARTYADFTCRGPDGKPTAIADSTSGWQAWLRPGTSFAPLADRCTAGSGIDAALTGPQQKHADGAWWRYVPPANTSLGGFRIEWHGVDQGGGESTLSRSDQPDPTYVQRNAGPFGQTVEQSGLDIAWLDALVACSFSPNPTCGSDPASFSITRARMTLVDLTLPQVSGVGGDLPAAAVVRGTMGVSFAAQDSGGGVYRVVLAADGVDGAAAPLPDTSGRCHDLAPGNADPYGSAGRSRVRSPSRRP